MTRRILRFAVSMVGVCGFVFVLGTVGAMDIQTISFQQGLIQCGIGALMMCSGMIGGAMI